MRDWCEIVAAARMLAETWPREYLICRRMGFPCSVGNSAFGGSGLQKKLLKHLSVPARDIATAGRPFPITARIDIQSGLESPTSQHSDAKLTGLVSLNAREGLTFAQTFGGYRFPPAIVSWRPENANQ